MEALNISQDNFEGDTSGDDVENEEGLGALGPTDARDETNNPLYSTFEAWSREATIPTPVLDSRSTDFRFYLLDCDSWASGELNPLATCGLPPFIRNQRLKPVMRLYGVSDSGCSVCIFVHGFAPYFYAIPSNPFGEEDIPTFTECINKAVLHNMSKDLHSAHLWKFVDEEHPPVVQVEILEQASSELNIFEYNFPTGRHPPVVLKISCVMSKTVWEAADVLKKGLVSFPFLDDPCTYQVHEGNLNPTLRFLTSLNMSCCSWFNIQLIPGQWYDRDSPLTMDPHLKRQSYCQIELDVDYECLTSSVNLNLPSPVAAKRSVLPKLRILSVDIECMTRPPNYIMPNKGNDRLLQIGVVIKDFDSQDPTDDVLVKAVFTLGTCDPIENAHVFSFEDEVSMLEAFRLLVCVTDPDIITGYNIQKFDIPFLLERAFCVEAKKFPYFGRMVRISASYRHIHSEDKRMNKHADTVCRVQGRIVFDMYPVIKQTFPFQQSFKLGEVARNLLENEVKDDVHYKDIFQLQVRSSETRNKLARYCLQDAWLPLQLMLKSPDPSEYPNFISYYCEKSRCSGSPLRYHVSKSDHYNDYFKTVRKQKNPNIIFPTFTPASRKREPSVKQDNQRGEKVRRVLFKDSHAL